MNLKEKKLFLEMLVTALTTYVFQRGFNKNIVVNYLELKESREDFLELLEDKYDGISRKYFEESNILKIWKERTDKSAIALERICNRIELNEYEEINISDIENEPIQSVYNYYQRKTGHISGKPIKKIKLPPEVISKLDEIVTEFGKQILRLNLLNEISDHLSFSEFYSKKRKKIAYKCADACWELYNSRTDYGKEPKNLNLNRSKFLEKILSSYHIKYYEELSIKEAEKKKRDSISQWFRDVENEKNIEIPK